MAEQAAENLNNSVLFRWTAKRDQAAMLLAEDDLSDAEIADRIGIGRSTLHGWKQHPDFERRVADYIAQLNAGMLRYRIAKRRHRIRIIDEIHSKALDVIDRRADRYQAQLGTDDLEVLAAQAAKAVLGGYVPAESATGLFVEKESVNNAGMRTVEWAVDTGLVRMIQSLHEQAERELGQRIDRSEVTQTVAVQIVGVDVEAI